MRADDDVSERCLAQSDTEQAVRDRSQLLSHRPWEKQHTQGFKGYEASRNKTSEKTAFMLDGTRRHFSFEIFLLQHARIQRCPSVLISQPQTLKSTEMYKTLKASCAQTIFTSLLFPKMIDGWIDVGWTDGWMDFGWMGG